MKLATCELDGWQVKFTLHEKTLIEGVYGIFKATDDRGVEWVCNHVRLHDWVSTLPRSFMNDIVDIESDSSLIRLRTVIDWYSKDDTSDELPEDFDCDMLPERLAAFIPALRSQ